MDIDSSYDAQQSIDRELECTLTCNNAYPLVKRLLVARANPNSYNQGRETLLTRTCRGDRSHHEDLVRALLEYKGLVDTQERDSGQTALMKVSTHGITKLLIKNNAQINIQDLWGRTALHHAIVNRNHSHDRAKVLLDAGANIFLKDVAGKRLCDIAREAKLRKVNSYTLYEIHTIEPWGEAPVDFHIIERWAEKDTIDLIRKRLKKAEQLVKHSLDPYFISPIATIISAYYDMDCTTDNQNSHFLQNSCCSLQ